MWWRRLRYSVATFGMLEPLRKEQVERDTRAIQAWLGHADIRHTVRYTALAEGRLKGVFPD